MSCSSALVQLLGNHRYHSMKIGKNYEIQIYSSTAHVYLHAHAIQELHGSSTQVEYRIIYYTVHVCAVGKTKSTMQHHF